MREKLNWWWFLCIAGVLIPVINLLFTHFDNVYYFFKGFFVSGLNPYLTGVSDFIIILLMTVIFKVISRVHLPSGALIFFHILSGLMALYLFVDFLIRQHVILPLNVSGPHRYIGSAIKETTWVNRYFHMSYTFIAIITFSFFFIINFPKRINKQIQ